MYNNIYCNICLLDYNTTPMIKYLSITNITKFLDKPIKVRTRCSGDGELIVDTRL